MSALPSIGTWSGGSAPDTSPQAIIDIASRPRERVFVVRAPSGEIGVSTVGTVQLTDATSSAPDGGHSLLGVLPPIYPEWLGDRAFTSAHGLRFPYVVGAMANGIATAQLVIDVGRAGMLGFFGAAGLELDRIRGEVERIALELDEPDDEGRVAAWGANLIHSPHEPELEAAVSALYIERGVKRVSASAYMELTAPVVRYALSGLRELPDGTIERRHHVFAKVSRTEVARRFMSPAPAELIAALLRDGMITKDEARLAPHVPVASDVTVESDSGGHTDNRPLGAVFSAVRAVRDEIALTHPSAATIRIGAAGGLGTPEAVASAFGLGASYVLTGSVNQATLQSGLSPSGRALLASAGIADVMMAPAADMFEMGVKVQVLRRGTLFGPRAQRLFDLYLAHPSLDAIPAAAKAKLEKEILGAPCSEVWASTRDYFASRDPAQVERAERDPKHLMALVFRAYLGQSSKWAIAGDEGRRMDFQIWCGPAMGAFNRWVKGSFLEGPETRDAVQVARNLLEGAAVTARASQLRRYGVPVPPAAFAYRPRPLD